eukprot:ANDGO_04540.mRNA.1 SPX and EXS domain-containing protein 3
MRMFHQHLDEDCASIHSFISTEHQSLSKTLARCQELHDFSACVSVYRRCEELKEFLSVNSVAWQKAVKKCLKAVSQTGFSFPPPAAALQLPYPPIATSSIDDVMHETEDLYSYNVHRNDHQRALAVLRAPIVRYSQRNVFILAFFLGLNVSIMFLMLAFIAYPPSIESYGEFSNEFTVFRMSGLAIFFYWLWGCCLFAWQRYKIHHGYLLQFQTRKLLSWLKMFKLCSVLTFIWLCGFAFYVGSRKKLLTFIPPEDAIYLPLITTLTLVVIFFMPTRGLLYWSSRKVLLQTLVRLFAFPFVVVRFRDIFFTDVLTSMVIPLSDLEFTICYYTTGNWLRPTDSYCSKTNIYAGPALAFLPFFWRALQCLRRYYDTKQNMNLVNFGKYLSAILVILFSALYDTYRSPGYRAIWLFLIPVSTVYAFLWDVMMDWGHPLSFKRPFQFRNLLRETRLYPSTSWYFAAIIIDGLLRFAWVSTISAANLLPVLYLKVLLAALELCRRAHWGIFRMEYEMILTRDIFSSKLGNVSLETDDGVEPSHSRPRKRASINGNGAVSENTSLLLPPLLPR